MVAPLYGLALIFQDLRPGSRDGAERAGHPRAEQRAVLAQHRGEPMPGGSADHLARQWWAGSTTTNGLRPNPSFAVLIVIGALGATLGSPQPQHPISLPGGARCDFRACRVFGAVLSGRHLPYLLGAVCGRRHQRDSERGRRVDQRGLRAALAPGESSARQMVQLGAGIAGYNVFTFIARNLDNVLIGRVWGDARWAFMIAPTSSFCSHCFR